MTRTFRRGYLEREPFGTYAITITKVKQNDNFGKWEDEDEDEIKAFGGYESKEEALEDIKKAKAKEILDENLECILKKED